MFLFCIAKYIYIIIKIIMDKSVNNIDDVEDDTMSSVYVAWRKISITFCYYLNYFQCLQKFPKQQRKKKKSIYYFYVHFLSHFCFLISPSISFHYNFFLWSFFLLKCFSFFFNFLLAYCPRPNNYLIPLS